MNVIKALLGNTYVTATLLFAFWIAAVTSGSLLAIAAGLVLYVRPMLYIRLVNSAVNSVSAKFADFTRSTTTGRNEQALAA